MAESRREAVLAERRRIVAFIRMKADKPWHVDNERAIVQSIANAVEAGEHLNFKPEAPDAEG